VFLERRTQKEMSEENSKEHRIETTKREFWWGIQGHGVKLRMKDDLDLKAWWGIQEHGLN
jgi:hypothetical protein